MDFVAKKDGHVAQGCHRGKKWGKQRAGGGEAKLTTLEPGCQSWLGTAVSDPGTRWMESETISFLATWLNTRHHFP